MGVGTIILIGIIFLVFIIFVRTIRIVPQKSAFIVERLGKFQAALVAGLHILIPFVDKVAYKHTLMDRRPAGRLFSFVTAGQSERSSCPLNSSG